MFMRRAGGGNGKVSFRQYGAAQWGVSARPTLEHPLQSTLLGGGGMRYMQGDKKRFKRRSKPEALPWWDEVDVGYTRSQLNSPLDHGFIKRKRLWAKRV